MNPTKNLIELKHYMNPTKILIELKHYMNPTNKLIEPKLLKNPTQTQSYLCLSSDDYMDSICYHLVVEDGVLEKAVQPIIVHVVVGTNFQTALAIEEASTHFTDD